MAKQRRNREKATELITLLDDIVPAKYPYRYEQTNDIHMFIKMKQLQT